MPSPFSKAQREEWKEKIINQRNSGDSVKGWCARHNISIHTFHYWQKILFPRHPLNRASFTELSDLNKTTQNSKDSGISLEYGGIKISLEGEFDSAILKQCLKAIKEVVC